EFTARVDRARIARDESLSVRFTVRADGANWTMDGPRFSAPDFEEIQQFSNIFVESYYENGKFGVRQNRQLTHVLRPRRTGTLKIEGIEVTVGGETYQAKPITIQVEAGGAATPPPKGYGGGSGSGLRGAGK